jgi:hypothetical protein
MYSLRELIFKPYGSKKLQKMLQELIHLKLQSILITISKIKGRIQMMTFHLQKKQVLQLQRSQSSQ